MNFEFTEDQLDQMVPRCKHTEELYEALLDVCPRYEINTEDRLAAFVAQCGYESADFNTLKENLNYSGDALCRVWPRHFTKKIKGFFLVTQNVLQIVHTVIEWETAVKKVVTVGVIEDVVLSN